MRYRKKPVVVDAWRYDPACPPDQRPIWVRDTTRVTDPMNIPPRLIVMTLEGRLLAMPGDWLIKGVKGEVYPCAPDVFAATYEEVSDAELFDAQLGGL